MGIPLDPMSAGPGTALRGGVRVLSEEEQQEQRREQDLARRRVNLDEPDKDVFFLEYLKYRGKKVSQSVTKMAKVMAKAGADDLSKTVSEEDAKQPDGALGAVADELGVSVEQLSVTVEQAGGDTAAFSDAIKGLAGMMSRKSAEERFDGKMLSEEESEEAREPGWAQTLRARAAALDKAADAMLGGAVTTGTPAVESARGQAEVFRAVADLVEQTEKASAAGGVPRNQAAGLGGHYDVTDLDEDELPALLKELERQGLITGGEAASARMMPMYSGIAAVSGKDIRFGGGDLLDNLRQRVAAEDAQLAALADPSTVFTGDRDSQRKQVEQMRSRHSRLLEVVEQLA